MQPIGDDSGDALVDGAAHPTIGLTQLNDVLSLEGKNLRPNQHKSTLYPDLYSIDRYIADQAPPVQIQVQLVIIVHGAFFTVQLFYLQVFVEMDR